MGVRGELDELLRPSLSDRRAPQRGERPWRLQSQVWVAFFGGVIAVTVIAFLNAKRLGMKPREQGLIVLAGVVGLAAICVSSAALGLASRDLRLLTRGIALAAYGAMYFIQRTADRTYSYHSPLSAEEEYDSLWIPGVLAVVALGLLQFAIVAAFGEEGA